MSSHWGLSFHSFHDMGHPSKAHFRGCAPQSSEVAKTWVRADQACNRMPFQVPGPTQGRDEALCSLTSLEVVQGQLVWDLGYHVSAVSEARKVNHLSNSSWLQNAMCILLKTIASLVWVSWSQASAMTADAGSRCTGTTRRREAPSSLWWKSSTVALLTPAAVCREQWHSCR